MLIACAAVEDEDTGQMAESLETASWSYLSMAQSGCSQTASTTSQSASPRRLLPIDPISTSSSVASLEPKWEVPDRKTLRLPRTWSTSLTFPSPFVEVEGAAVIAIVSSKGRIGPPSSLERATLPGSLEQLAETALDARKHC